ncbi:hypothetical protein [Gordonia sp. (in: high G+C Gram-positive bacteria)]
MRLDPDTYSSFRSSVELRDPRPADLATYRQMMVNLDPPDHSQY